MSFPHKYSKYNHEKSIRLVTYLKNVKYQPSERKLKRTQYEYFLPLVLTFSAGARKTKGSKCAYPSKGRNIILFVHTDSKILWKRRKLIVNYFQFFENCTTSKKGLENHFTWIFSKLPCWKTSVDADLFLLKPFVPTTSLVS